MASLKESDRKRLTLIAALLPGAGQLACGRFARGLACGVVTMAAVAAVLLDAWVLAPFLGPAGRWVAIVLAAGAYGLGIADTAMLVRRRFDPARGERRIAIFRRGNLLVMQNRLAEARKVYMEAVERDRSDVSALLKVATLDLLTGDESTARIHLQECRHLEDAERWRYQIDAAMARVAGPASEETNGETPRRREPTGTENTDARG